MHNTFDINMDTLDFIIIISFYKKMFLNIVQLPTR